MGKKIRNKNNVVLWGFEYVGQAGLRMRLDGRISKMIVWSRARMVILKKAQCTCTHGWQDMIYEV